jgi:acyl-CoA synthetase (NDP forming)
MHTVNVALEANPSAPKYKKPFDYLFRPASIAVIGASSDTLKPGGRVLKLLREHGYAGDLWPVNPKAEHIAGLPAFKAIAALPSAPDLAIVGIPAALVVPALTELAAKGAGAVIVLTSGFSEKDEAGKRLEQSMLEIARTAGMSLIGPNCSGFLTKSYKGKFAGLVPDLPGGAVDVISGSGATVDYIMEQASFRGLSFGNVVNLGNSAMLGVEDLLAMYDENYDEDCARVLMIYMESVRKPQLLLKHARSLAAKGCALVGIKSGVTDAGRRAAASHTGAMASSDTAVQALFEKAGIIRVQNKTELIDMACALVALRGRPAGRRACVITDAGGPGVMCSDAFSRWGWELPPLSEVARKRLCAVLPPESATGNPIDMLPSRNADQVRKVLTILAEEQGRHLDAIAVITGDSGMADNWSIYQEIARGMEENPVPILPVLSSTLSSREAIARFIRRGKVYFHDEVSLAAALGRISTSPQPQPAGAAPAGYRHAAIAAVMEGQSGALPPDKVRQILGAAGFAVPVELEVFQEEQLIQSCRRTGFPLVMKVIGPLHKTDVGGVKLGIADDDRAREAFHALMRIPEARGVLLQPMIQGSEVIMGASREEGYGQLIMFGLGGIYTEVLKDVQFALAPLSPDECLRMIRSIRSRAVLEGVRGQTGMSTDVLADYLQRLGRLAADFDCIREIDLNPVKGTAGDLFAVDARIIVD